MRQLRLNALAVMLGTIGAFCILVFAEGLVRVFHFRRPKIVTYAYTNRPPFRDLKFYDKESPNHLKVRLPKPLYSSRPIPPNKEVHFLHQPSYFAGNSEYGTFGIPNAKSAVDLESFDGVRIHANYTTDSFGRRTTVGQPKEKKRKLLLFFGCSFTFGDQINDDQTVASFAQNLLSEVTVHNYGFTGWGPGNALRMINSQNFAEDLSSDSEVQIVYFFIDHQINRVVHTLDLYRVADRWSDWSWANSLPYYFLNPQGELDTGDMLGNLRTKDWIFRQLANSQMLTLLNLQWPLWFGASELRLVSTIFSHIEKSLLRKFPKSKFTVVFYPRWATGRALIPYLDEFSIRTLDYSTIDPSQYVMQSELLEGHPSPEMNRFLARQVLMDLGYL